MFRFWVEMHGILVGGFSEVTGLQSETEIEEYREGGENGYIHRFPKQRKFSTIVLRRGVSDSRVLWDWYAMFADGKISRKSGSIIMQQPSGEEMYRWNFIEAYPIKWNGPELNASRSEIAIESIELVHNGLVLAGKRQMNKFKMPMKE